MARANDKAVTHTYTPRTITEWVDNKTGVSVHRIFTFATENFLLLAPDARTKNTKTRNVLLKIYKFQIENTKQNGPRLYKLIQ